MAARFVPPRVPIADPRTGMVTREWFLFFQSLFSTTAGIPEEDIDMIAPASSNADAVAIIGYRLDEALLAPPAPAPVFYSADDVLPVISGLRDEIAMLRGMIDDMMKGPRL